MDKIKYLKVMILLLTLFVGLFILFMPDAAMKLFSSDPYMWAGYCAAAVIGVGWIFLGPLMVTNGLYVDSLNEATVVASIIIFLVTITNWHGLGSLVPLAASIVFGLQTGRHRFFS